uniref:Disease resistance protein RGA5 n=1 Tax=Oryza sativa subsp. japonica TaxID=39947 RepID=UPI001E69840A|nr:Chain A, Disease resistance protein RGA5 [Oryza sativa Japonica Group]7DVG_B Chain B, Disease resistance protein RGA5 [Oryza sativa Japonica Group]
RTKIVVKVHMPCDKSRAKAVALAASVNGVDVVEITGEDKDRLEVVGRGIDPVRLVALLREKCGLAELLMVELV